VWQNGSGDTRGGTLEPLRRFRRQLGLTQQELADKAGVSQYTITEIETGRREARPSTLRKLADALDVEVADFFRESEAPKDVVVPMGIGEIKSSGIPARVTVEVPAPLFLRMFEVAMDSGELDPDEQRQAKEAVKRSLVS
jgi:transcriptional regulator with XRE-family HTH domain